MAEVEAKADNAAGDGGARPSAESFAVEARHLRALLTHIDGAVIAYDEDGYITFASNGVGELLGYEAEGLVGRHVSELLHPDDLARALADRERLIAREGPALEENVRLRTATGSMIELASETVTGLSVAPFGAGVATLRSVHDSTAIEQELRQRLIHEERLIRLARTFVADELGGDAGFDASVERALAEMGSLEAVDSVGLWRYEDGLVHHTHQWVASPIPRSIGDWRPFDPENLGLTRRLARGEEVALNKGEEPPDDLRIEYDGLIARGAHSFLAVPMITDGQFTGFVSFASHQADNSFSLTHLATLRAAAGILAEAFARRRAEAALHHRARHDSLTGLANRWAFREDLEGAVDATNDGTLAGVAVLLLDLDRFSVINDALGHSAGDQLLIAIADRLRAGMRDDEVLARLGGDEMVVLLRGVASPAEALARAEAILTECFAEPFAVGPSSFRIGASIGVAHHSGAGSEAGGLLREADAAMFAAKARGGRQAYVFDDLLRRRATRRLEHEHDLHGAVERGELELHYQPEYDLQTRAIIGAEALLRWHHPRHGFLTASEFIDVAEDSGLIVDIGYWVIEQGLHQLADWQARGADPGLVMRLNLSARQTADTQLADQIRALAAGSGVDPARVCFELTETAIMTDAAQTSSVLEQLHDQGFSIAIDDFGTGYSSLAYLRTFPVDVLKIDREFVTTMGNGATGANGAAPSPDETLVRAILSMAEALDLHVTAEGIETQAQLDALLRLGCAHGQGYFLAKPAPATSLAALLGL